MSCPQSIENNDATINATQLSNPTSKECMYLTEI